MRDGQIARWERHLIIGMLTRHIPDVETNFDRISPNLKVRTICGISLVPAYAAKLLVHAHDGGIDHCAAAS